MESFKVNDDGSIPFLSVIDELEKRGIKYRLLVDTGLGYWATIYASEPELVNPYNSKGIHIALESYDPDYIDKLMELCKNRAINEIFFNQSKRNKRIVVNTEIDRDSVLIYTALSEYVKNFMKKESFESLLRDIDNCQYLFKKEKEEN